jgi:hypothetical protein
MARGKKPVAAIGEAKGFAERMEYRWMDNPDADLPFDFLIYKPAAFRAVKVRLTRHRIDPDAFYEELFPDEIRGLRGLPFPQFILRELWVRTQHERTWRRFVVHDISVMEIEWWKPDGYTNPYAR